MKITKKNIKDCDFYSDNDIAWKYNLNSDNFWTEKELRNKVVVMTYHKFSYLLKNCKRNNIDIHFKFDLIICDEIHNLYYFQRMYGENEENVLKNTADWLNLIAINSSNDNLRIVALSATPDKAYKIFPEDKIKPVLKESELKDVKRYSTNGYTFLTVDNIIMDLPKGRGIIFVHHIRTMKKYAEIIHNKYPKLNIQMIWSLKTHEKAKMNGKTEEIMTDEQLKIWDFIFEKEAVPSDIDILFINKSCETCVNINSKVDNDNRNYKINYMVIDTDILDTIFQVRGRYRDDLDLGYHFAMNPTHIYIPNEYLNKWLDKQERDKLCDEINYYDEKGNFKGWPTIKEKLEITRKYEVKCEKKSTNYYEIIPI